MKDLVEVIEALKEKVNKHDEKLKAHKESEIILKTEHEELEGKDSTRQENVGAKLSSTIDNINYHNTTSKTYKKVIAMLE